MPHHVDARLADQPMAYLSGQGRRFDALSSLLVKFDSIQNNKLQFYNHGG